MTGPQQERLRQNVDGADHGQVTSAGFDWKAKGDLLDIVASQLEFNATAPREAMGGQTGVATSEAFARSGKAMAAKSAELQHGGEILMKSGQAIKNAEDEHRSLGAQPGAPTEPAYDSGSPQTKAELRQHSEHQAAAAAWQAEYDRREKRAEKANLELEQALRGYSNDMAKIHGENMDKPSSVQGGSGSVAAPGGGGTAYGGGGGGGNAGGGGRGDQSHTQGEIIEFVPHHPTHDTPPTTTGTPPSGGDVGAGTGTGTSTAPAASAQGGSSSPVLGQTTVPGGSRRQRVRLVGHRKRHRRRRPRGRRGWWPDGRRQQPGVRDPGRPGGLPDRRDGRRFLGSLHRRRQRARRDLDPRTLGQRGGRRLTGRLVQRAVRRRRRDRTLRHLSADRRGTGRQPGRWPRDRRGQRLRPLRHGRGGPGRRSWWQGQAPQRPGRRPPARGVGDRRGGPRSGRHRLTPVPGVRRSRTTSPQRAGHA